MCFQFINDLWLGLLIAHKSSLLLRLRFAFFMQFVLKSRWLWIRMRHWRGISRASVQFSSMKGIEAIVKYGFFVLIDFESIESTKGAKSRITGVLFVAFIWLSDRVISSIDLRDRLYIVILCQKFSRKRSNKLLFYWDVVKMVWILNEAFNRRDGHWISEYWIQNKKYFQFDDKRDLKFAFESLRKQSTIKLNFCLKVKRNQKWI